MQDDDDLFIIIGASAQELPDVQALCERAGDRSLTSDLLSLCPASACFLSLHLSLHLSRTRTHRRAPHARRHTLPALFSRLVCMYSLGPFRQRGPPASTPTHSLPPTPPSPFLSLPPSLPPSLSLAPPPPPHFLPLPLRPVILFNMKLQILRGDLGLPFFPGRDLHNSWLSTALPAYHVRPTAYTRTIASPPFLINYSGALFRTWPGKWQVNTRTDACKETRECVQKDLRMRVKRAADALQRPTKAQRMSSAPTSDTDVCVQAYAYECVQRDVPMRLHRPNGCQHDLPTASACQETY